MARRGELKIAIWEPGVKCRVARRERPRRAVGSLIQRPGGGTAGAGLAISPYGLVYVISVLKSVAG